MEKGKIKQMVQLEETVFRLFAQLTSQIQAEKNSSIFRKGDQSVLDDTVRQNEFVC